ncbi:HxlR family transcriptional regulator [Promicromonospora sp. AC04]|nr:winged helix-turn-helix transcriptional regulator [Promicromonospora sp. AC04]PUB27609.1 HxlR family transcriptional regulator [Promicromonospora sp. AC04]
MIANLDDGPRRYTHLQRAVPDISQRMLTLTLRQLDEDGLVSRTAYAEVPPRVEHSLTPWVQPVEV